MQLKCVSIKKRSMKELIVALEWSENDKILAEIFKWVEQQAEIKDSSESCSPTRHDSEIVETVGAVIKMETTEEMINVDQDVTIPAEMDDSLPQAPSEAPPEMSNDDQVSAPEAPTKRLKCRFKGCQLEFGSPFNWKNHYKDCHDGHCVACGRTDARLMIKTRYLNNCCNSPNIVGGPFPCVGHCRKVFHKESRRRSHLRDVMWDCRKCGLKFRKRDKHSC